MRRLCSLVLLGLLAVTTAGCSERAEQEAGEAAKEVGREASEAGRRVADEAEERLGDREVSVKDFAFSPAETTVEVGVQVRWRNEDTVEHTATADNGSFDVTLSPGSDGTFRFTQRGEFPYVCTLHPDQMRGVVRVQ